MLFLFLVQDVTHIDRGYALASEFNVLDDGLSLAGFEVTLYGRFWVTPEDAERYHAAGRSQKKQILDEFIKVTGYHRKHAIRALRRTSGKLGAITAIPTL